MATVVAESPSLLSSTLSAAPYLALIQDPDTDLVQFAVESLNGCVAHAWPEIAASLSIIESLAENVQFAGHESAALLAAKVYFYLGDCKTALQYILRAGDAFDVTGTGDFVQTIVTEAIDQYVALRAALAEEQSDVNRLLVLASPPARIDPRLERMFERTLERSADASRMRSLVGVLIEAVRFDLLQRCVMRVRELALASPSSTSPSTASSLSSASSTSTLNVTPLTATAPGSGTSSSLSVITTSSTTAATASAASSPTCDAADQAVLSLLSYIFSLCYGRNAPLQGRRIRQSCLHFLVSMYGHTELLAEPDYLALATCLVLLDLPEEVASLLLDLVRDHDGVTCRKLLFAYQIAFDLYETAPQPFVERVLASYRESSSPRSAVSEPSATSTLAASTLSDASAAAAAEPVDTEMDDTGSSGSSGSSPNTATNNNSNNNNSNNAPTSPNEEIHAQMENILSGKLSVNLFLEFLFKKSHADQNLMARYRDTLDARVSSLHHASLVCNGFMHAGTTQDSFLRQNIDWLDRAYFWSRFTAASTLGVIHMNRISQGMELMRPYLPGGSNQAAASITEEQHLAGGALFGLGLIYSQIPTEEVREYLFQACTDAHQFAITANAARGGADNGGRAAGNNPHVPTVYGSCLGLGLTGMGTGNSRYLSLLQDVVFQDEAECGESAALAMGLILAGRGIENDEVQEMFNTLLQYAHETKHEKITRGIAICFSLLCSGQEELAQPVIAKLVTDKEPILRYGAMYALGSAYVGTGNSEILRQLLHHAVSDVNDDVRRAAVINIGFLLCKQPDQCPRMLSLLSTSFNSHVRYGCALALGISCSGTCNNSAIDMLNELLKDPVDFVRQGAYIGMSMVMIQASNLFNSNVEEFRKLLLSKSGDRHEMVVARIGAVFGSGIIDAGGRNVTISLHRHHFPKIRSVAGMILFTQYWFWFPLVNFLSLTFQPTAFIGLNAHLEMPSFPFRSLTKQPGVFAYPEPYQAESKPVAPAAPTAVLSTFARTEQNRREKEKSLNAPNSASASSSSSSTTTTATPSTSDSAALNTSTSTESGTPAAAAASSASSSSSSSILMNPVRIVPAQEAFVSFDASSRYVPLKKGFFSGVVMLLDRRPQEEKELVARAAPGPVSPTAAGETEQEAPVPEPFTYP